MGKAFLGYGLGLGIITLGGLVLCFNEPPMAQVSGQFNLFMVFLKTYNPLLAPISSVSGYPAIGGHPSPGIIPLVLWTLTGLLVGVLLRSAGGAAKAMFLTSATVLILWISSLFFSAPAWPDQRTWLLTISSLAKDFISRPIDLVFILMAPMIVSAVTGQLLEVMRERLMRERNLEDRYMIY